MTDTDEAAAIAAFVDSAAAMLGLTLAPEHRPGVIAAFTAFKEAAARFMTFPVPEEIEETPTSGSGQDCHD